MSEDPEKPHADVGTDGVVEEKEEQKGGGLGSYFVGIPRSNAASLTKTNSINPAGVSICRLFQLGLEHHSLRCCNWRWRRAALDEHSVRQVCHVFQ